MEDGYKKSLLDEVDWKIIDQLHNAVSNFSSASIEVKKIFFALLTALIAIGLKLTPITVDWKLFVSAYVLIGVFWYLDSFTYYYQDSLRAKIDERFINILQRNSAIDSDNPDPLTLADSRTNATRLKRSIIAPAVWIYPILATINTIILIIHLS